MTDSLVVFAFIMTIKATFGQTHDPLIEDFINSLHTTTLKPRSCGVHKECVPFYRCKAVDSDDSTCGYPDTCCEVSDKINTTNPNTLFEGNEEHERCGYRSVGFETTGNEDSGIDFGEFPWYASLMTAKEPAHENYFCNGVIIASTAVLTTAACVEAAKQLYLRAGEWIGIDEKYIQHRARRVDKVIMHEDYDASSFSNNIALLIVESPFQWEKKVRPVCLPEANMSFDEARCYFTNWTDQKTATRLITQGILRRVDAPIVPQAECIATFRKYVDSIRKYKFDLCAGGKEGKTYDVFDSGAPLVCPVPGMGDRYFLAGVASYSLRRPDVNEIAYIPSKVPRVLTSVQLLLEWLNDKLTQNGIDVSQLR